MKAAAEIKSEIERATYSVWSKYRDRPGVSHETMVLNEWDGLKFSPEAVVKLAREGFEARLMRDPLDEADDEG